MLDVHPKSQGVSVRYGEATDTADEVCFLMHTACQTSPKLFHTEF